MIRVVTVQFQYTHQAHTSIMPGMHQEVRISIADDYKYARNVTGNSVLMQQL